MCGIGGVYTFGDSKLSLEDSERLRDLAISLESRGTDAFGFYNGETVIKFPSSASEILSMLDRVRPFEQLVAGKRMCLMHTRASTVGDPLRNKNNHPFETKHFVLAHNGTLWYYKSVTKHYDKAKKCFVLRDDEDDNVDIYEIFGVERVDIPETDSFSIIYDLQKTYNDTGDLHKSLEEVLEEYSAYGTLAVWVYSKAHDALALFRSNNPLFYVDEGDKVWFASEEWMLKAIGLSNIKRVDEGELRIYYRDGEVVKDYIVSTAYWGKGKRCYCWYYDEERQDEFERFKRSWWDYHYLY